jgi:hypothetical protein
MDCMSLQMGCRKCGDNVHRLGLCEYHYAHRNDGVPGVLEELRLAREWRRRTRQNELREMLAASIEGREYRSQFAGIGEYHDITDRHCAGRTTCGTPPQDFDRPCWRELPLRWAQGWRIIDGRLYCPNHEPQRQEDAPWQASTT